MKFKKQAVKASLNEVLPLLLTGLVIGAHWFLFFESARISTVSVCLAGMATTTFWTSIVEPLFKGRKIAGIELVLGLVVIAGLYLIFSFEFTHAKGLVLAVLSALMASIFSVLNSKFTLKHSPYKITFYEMLGATIGVIVFIPFYKSYLLNEPAVYAVPTTRDWSLLAVLSIVCTVYAFSVSVELMKRISAFIVNLTINLEPVYGILMALLLYGEKEEMSAGFYYGTLVIIAAVLYYPLHNRRKRRAKE